MAELSAIRVALELHHTPARVKAMRAEPLPGDLELLLRVAANEPDALAAAAAQTGKSQAMIAAAAGFYIEQVLLSPDAEAYRILGASSAAPPATLRRHMALILKWMHPDMDRAGDRSVFVTRVTQAWERVKSPERRAAYDAELAALRQQAPAQRPGSRHRDGRPRPRPEPRREPGMFRSLALYLASFRKS